MSEKTKKSKANTETLQEYLEQHGDHVAQVFKEYGFDAPVSEKTLFQAYTIAGDKFIDRLYELETGRSGGFDQGEVAYNRKRHLEDIICSVMDEKEFASFTGEEKENKTDNPTQPAVTPAQETGFFSNPATFWVLVVIVLLVIVLANGKKPAEE